MKTVDELIRAKKADVRWIHTHVSEIVEYMENSQFFEESDIDYPVMSLTYHMLFEIKEAMEKQHDNYSKST